MDVTIHKIAQKMFLAFERSFTVFTRLTRQSQAAFEDNDWSTIQSLSQQRIDVYESNLEEAVALCQHGLNDNLCGLNFWQELKLEFQTLLPYHPQFELAETFYNSVLGRVCQHARQLNDEMFIMPTRCHLPGYRRQRILLQMTTETTPHVTLEQLFSKFQWQCSFENKQRDQHRIITAFREHLGIENCQKIFRIDLLKAPLYRNQQAYIVGKVCFQRETAPFVIALSKNEDKSLYVDTVLLKKRHISALFGFARAPFLVDTPCPAETVLFLKTILHKKPTHELYSTLGYYKHSKTEFYRAFIDKLERNDEQFELTPGIPGLVMAVFHLPSFNVVFKIIRDVFPESKSITHEQVRQRYQIIKRHDKVGRMADTSEYVNFQLPLNKVSAQLLTELKTTCNNQIKIIGNKLIIKHLYIERKMTPLNLFLQQPLTNETLHDVIDDLGATIKQIAKAQLFPGDMLQKNFGVTRHGRVIFYDYDEICPIAERNFRALPSNDDPYGIDTLSVGPEDVFPEQFKHFIVTAPNHKKLLMQLHPEIFDYRYWQSLKMQTQFNPQTVLPYPETIRFDKD